MIKTSYQDAKNASLYEPRIEFIKKQLESLLSVVDLEAGGRLVRVDSFRLKELKDWVVPSACDPIEVFGHAAARCNCDCIFCYNKGNPPALALGNLRRPPAEELEEMRTRIRYLSETAESALFVSLGDIYEVLMHPHIMETLRQLRQQTAKVFRITTNGRNLTADLISELAELKPVYLYLSLNSASPWRRRMLMRDPEPQLAIDSLPLLRDEGLPYAVVIVPWPVDSTNEMLDDLERTVAYADTHDAHLVQVNLPGYSRYFSAEKLFDLEEVWSKTVAVVRNLRRKVACPIVVMPSMYEENRYEPTKNLPRIIGLVKNSPAALSGLRLDDQIEELNGLRVSTRPQARDLLSTLHKSGLTEAGLTVARGGRSFDIAMNLERFSYPYCPTTDQHLGIIMMGTGLRMSYMERLKHIIDSYQARHVLLLSSTLVRPTLEQCLSQCHLFDSSQLRIDIEVPDNHFLGGNVFMGDLLVVQDFIDCIQEHLRQRKVKPDLIVIPSSPFNLSQWGRDLTGRVYLDIERQVGIPVALLECSTIYD